MNDNDIEKLALTYYPINNAWIGTPGRNIDQNIRERRCWIEGFKIAVNANNMLLKEIALILRNGGFDDNTVFGKLYLKLQQYD